MPRVETLPVFTREEAENTKIILATKVASMMGRKLEEGDWGSVYSKAKNIPDAGWSNLHIDINYNGLGVEHKLLRCAQLGGRPIKSMCGTTLMHPAATRSIRIDNIRAPASDVMRDVFRQYAELISLRTNAVRSKANGNPVDMRVGWLLWENNLTEFLYFEERMLPPNPDNYYAEWNDTAAKGARKESRSLWIYDSNTRQKRYSVTTSAGIKIQPYFDVPDPLDPNLCYFRVQSEFLENGMVLLWLSSSTANGLKRQLGGELTPDVLSEAVLRVAEGGGHPAEIADPDTDRAVPVPISRVAYDALLTIWDSAVSDEHRGQLLLKALT